MVYVGYLRWGTYSRDERGECGGSVCLLLVVKVSECEGGVVTIDDMEVEGGEVEVYFN